MVQRLVFPQSFVLCFALCALYFELCLVLVTFSALFSFASLRLCGNFTLHPPTENVRATRPLSCR